ncbi:hypothetical protein ICG_06031 [Bacillus cereus BAG1X1-3]|nr:hypothetical protein ICG_06031 [Bacillus cereus BAG1X1-3]
MSMKIHKLCNWCERKEATHAFTFPTSELTELYCEECYNELVSIQKEQEELDKTTFCFYCNESILIESAQKLMHEFAHCNECFEKRKDLVLICDEQDCTNSFTQQEGYSRGDIMGQGYGVVCPKCNEKKGPDAEKYIYVELDENEYKI